MRTMAIIFMALAFAAPASPPDPGGAWELVVLGIAQDGGMPHAGCSKPPCSEVRAGTRRAEKVRDLRTITPDRALELSGDLRVTPMRVPHRDEFTDTVGFLIEGPRSRVLFIPDIDKWEKWDRSLREMAGRADVLLLDGTFSTMDELPGRDIAQVPHPLMTETRALLEGTRARLWFIHLNHSNPALLDGKDVAREGMVFPL